MKNQKSDRTDIELANLRRQHQLILNSVGEGIYGLDARGNVTFVNPAAAAIIGWDMNDLVGKSMHRILHHSKADGREYPRESCPIYAAFKDGKVHRVENEVFWRKNGTSFPVEYISTPMHDENGDLIGAVVTFRDITQRKLSEAILQQANEELERRVEQRTEELSKANQQLKQLNEVRSRFVAMVCHEFRNPLNNIAFLVSSLMRYSRKLSANKKNEYLSDIEVNIDRMTQMTDELLVISKIDNESINLKADLLNIVEFCQRLIAEFEKINRKSKIKFNSNLSELKVRIDERLLWSIIVNLLSNAVKYSPQKSEINFYLEAKGDRFAVIILEKTDLRIGFIPITCATPIIMSEPLGFYEKYGFNAEVVKMPSWGAVRDSAIAGELDAYHMLAPMPIAMTLGLGSSAFGVKLASIENINGQAITVANKYKGQVNGPADFKGFNIGVPFPYSMHNLLLRYYLATGGIDPDKDVKIRAVPPPDSIAQLVAGDIDAYLMPDPFNQRAVYEEAGFIHKLTKELWDGHPCCAFTASDEWISANPNTFRALNKAIIEAAGYAQDPANRPEIAKAISERAFLNQPVEVVEAVLTGNFENGLGETKSVPDRIGFDPYPWQSFANWISSQLVRWDLQGDGKVQTAIAEDKYEEVGKEIFMTDLARELAQEVGLNPPEDIYREETLEFDSFNPENPQAYVDEQIEKYGV